MDRIFVEGLALRGRHGVNHKEREEEQGFLIDISVQFDTALAVQSDNIADTADYTKFVEIARECVEQRSFYLIERLADTIARRILEDSRVALVSVTIRKPEVLESGTPGVTIIRTRV